MVQHTEHRDLKTHILKLFHGNMSFALVSNNYHNWLIESCNMINQNPSI